MNELERHLRAKNKDLEKAVIEQGGILAMLFNKYRAIMEPEDRESVEAHRRGLRWKLHEGAENVNKELLGSLVIARRQLQDTWCSDGCSHPACNAAMKSFQILDGTLRTLGFNEGIR